MGARELTPRELARRCDAQRFGFDTTHDLPDLQEVIGQPRATAALRFGMSMRQPGFNLFVVGPPGSGRHATVRLFLNERAAGEPVPDDLCYVFNFGNPQRPAALSLPPGMGSRLAADMDRLVEELGTALPAAFETEQYRLRRQALDEELSHRQEQLFEQLRQQARERGLYLGRSPGGLVFTPMRDGEVMGPEDFRKLSEEERKRLEGEVEAVQKSSQELLRQVPRWEQEHREKVRALNREVATHAVGFLIDQLRQRYAELEQVVGFLNAVERDVVENYPVLVGGERGPGQGGGEGGAPAPAGQGQGPMRRYRVNLIVDGGGQDAAPVVYEDNPSYPNLVGRIEHRAEMGALLTDFHLIKAGSLHRANGGYLILDAHKLVSQQFAWEGLKRALRSGEVRIESVGQVFGMVSTVSLEPQPVPLQTKVVLIGEPRLFYMLQQLDPDFDDLFKVTADFDDRMVRDEASEDRYAALIATVARRHRLPPFDRHAVARLIEHSSRAAGDCERLSTEVRELTEVLSEAAHWAREAGRPAVAAQDVQRAVDERIYRSDRVRERLREQILRDTILVDTSGTVCGQINGLAVLQVAGFAFGRPSRITARIRMGDGKVVDIEREVEMGGPTHTKGVLILSSFLASRYAVERPLSLSASLVFEQSYSGVDGDSASSAELYALLSAIAGLPIRQSLAVTGSVNQLGQVQAIGGVNEKVEGFFEVCRERGLTGDQGVLIPASNVKHLMLRHEVVEAVEAGRFHVHAVDTIDAGIEILTGVAAGQADGDGVYPADSVNGRVQQRLTELAQKREALRRREWGAEEE